MFASMPAHEETLNELASGLAEAGKRIEPILLELFPPAPEDYMSGPFWYHMGSGGKRIRPALCLLCCEALGGESERAIHFAAAVEILHNLLIIHDDVEDGDTVRRDMPTVWVKFGIENAINLGDYMLGRAYHATWLSPVDTEKRLRLVEAFTQTCEHTCLGQAIDLNSRGKDDFTIERYLEMVALKTGHYLALGMVGGAIIAGLHEQGVREIQKLGCDMGSAFQIRDDLIDLTQGKGRGGAKGNDIREGKPSILYAHAVSAADEPDRRRLLEVMRKPRGETTDADVDWVVGLYERLGSLRFAREKADVLVNQAFDTIERIPVENKGFFRRVARFMVDRMI